MSMCQLTWHEINELIKASAEKAKREAQAQKRLNRHINMRIPRIRKR